MFKKIFIIATEPSGDLIGHKILKVFKDKYPNIVFKGLGGEKMESESFKSDFPIKELSVNGIYEVLIRIFKLRKMFFSTLLSIRKFNPDLIITIDSPSFNYRIVNKLQKFRNQYKFVHFVAPTVWAWKKYRAKQFAEKYDLLLTLFDFEPKYFQQYNKNVFCIGHPIFFKKKKKIRKKKEVISFFPGSRTNEIEFMLPKMIQIIKKLEKNYKKFEFIIITLPFLEKKIKKFIENKSIKIISTKKQKDHFIKNSKLAIASSGTVILELVNNMIPSIVVYDSNYLTSLIVKKMVNVKWANLVNIIQDKEIIPEFLFSRYTVSNVVNCVEEMLNNEEKICRQLSEFSKFRRKMIVNMKNPIDVALNHIQKRVMRFR